MWLGFDANVETDLVIYVVVDGIQLWRAKPSPTLLNPR